VTCSRGSSSQEGVGRDRCLRGGVRQLLLALSPVVRMCVVDWMSLSRMGYDSHTHEYMTHIHIRRMTYDSHTHEYMTHIHLRPMCYVPSVICGTRHLWYACHVYENRSSHTYE